MAVQVAKKPAVVVAKPTVAPAAKPALVAVPAVDTTETVEEGAEEEVEAPVERKKRKDFASHEDFCDYKVALAEVNVVKWTDRVALWKAKKLNKDADQKAKDEKKAEKLIAAFVQVQTRLGKTPEQIQKMVEAFKAMNSVT